MDNFRIIITVKALLMLRISKTAMEKFTLKWNDFSCNAQKTFQNLRKEEDFFDITLVGEDFNHVTAHKIVLSSSSEYFKTVFSNNKKYFQSHALICMEGLNQGDLNNVLDYIYHGEVQINQHDLNRFLGIAERLKLEGLIGAQQLKDENGDITDNILDDYINDYDFPKSKKENQMTKDVKKTEKIPITAQSSDIQSLEELDQKVEESYIRDSRGLFACNHCSRSFKKKCHIKEHVEIHFEGLSFSCSYCDAVLRSRNALRKHTIRLHN